MGEGQPRYSTEITNEYFYKYRPREEFKFGILLGNDKDIPQKTWTGFKYGLFAGVSATAIMALEENKPVVLVRALERGLRHGIPWVISGTMYGLTVSTVANLRNKSDSVNHFCGGVVSGAMLGSWYKNTTAIRWCALIFGITGSIVKTASDMDQLPKFPVRQASTLNMYRSGWFIERPDPEGIRDGDKDDSFQNYRP